MSWDACDASRLNAERGSHIGIARGIERVARCCKPQKKSRCKNVARAGRVQFVGRPRRNRKSLDFVASSPVNRATVPIFGEYNKRSVLQELAKKLQLSVNVLNRQDEYVEERLHEGDIETVMFMLKLGYLMGLQTGFAAAQAGEQQVPPASSTRGPLQA